jgi:hypothetical protein
VHPDHGTFVLDYRRGYVLVNELLRGFNAAYFSEYARDYVRGFYLPNLGRLFYASYLTNGGRYPLRESADDVVRRFWPEEDTSSWRPRFGDPGPKVAALHRVVTPLEWVAAVVLLLLAMRSRGSRIAIERARLPLLLVGFALAFGAAVAWTHTLEIRYHLPLRPILVVGAALLGSRFARAAAGGKRDAERLAA